MGIELICGDALEELRKLPDESVHCCVTSPPYWGLRDYGVDGQLGLEKTPEEYVGKLVEIFREVRRVLRNDGTCWVNLGDSYANQKTGDTYSGFNDRYFNRRTDGGKQAKTFSQANIGKLDFHGYKPKDLIGIPWWVAFALQADGWWLRQDIIWQKPNPMPESVTDRCTKAHEYIFLLTKSAKYYYNAEAISEPDSGQDHPRNILDGQASLEPSGGIASAHGGIRKADGRNGEGRNKRSVWTIATQPYPEAHFATFPEELPRLCILAGCLPGGTVLDPFCGSGTTGLAARKLGNRFIGIELNPAYIQLANRRIHSVPRNLLVNAL